MEQACAGCGYRSGTRSFFRREKSGVFGRRKAFCRGCAPYRPTRLENLSVHSVWLSAIGALLVASGLQGPVPTVGYSLVLIGALSLSHVVTTIAHELGHAVAARLVGMKVVRIVVGSGPVLAAREWQGIRFELHRYLLAGGMTAAYHQIESPAKWRQIVMLLGGVGANFLLIVLATCVLVLLVTRFGHSNPFFFTVAFVLLALQIISQIIAIIANLLPRKVHHGHAARATDGKLLIYLLFAKDFRRRAQEARIVWQGMALLQSGRNVEAQAHFEQAHRLLPTNGAIFLLLVHSASKTAGPQAAVRYYRERGGEFAGENEAANAWAYANVAWNAVLTQDPAMLPLADDLSRRAIASLPAAPEVQGTRGAVLVEMGELEQGLALLTEGMRGVAVMDDKARFAHFLAHGVRARGNSDLATELEKLGRHLSALLDSK
jgi:tetratricopeptide (TPR) repeat protein